MTSQSQSPHDVIILMTDQQRADLCGREGFPVDCTPAVDALAAQGRWFDRAYTSAPVCVPARISLLTGRFPSAHRARENAALEHPDYSADLMDVARAAGLRTAVIGKNHSHLTADRVDTFIEYGHFGRKGPDESGFPAWLRDLGSATATEATPFPVPAQSPARIVDDAIGWLDQGESDRSLLWLSIPEPHVPYQVPEPYFSTYTFETVPPPATGAESLDHRTTPWRWLAAHGAEVERQRETLLRARANYVGMIRLIDDQIARLVGHLECRGRLARTLIVFLSDHGDFAGEYGLMRKGPELPEVLTRIPLVFSGAGVDPGPGPSPAHVSIVDVFPTLCELLGQPVPEGVQGRSLVPILRGRPFPEREFDSVYAEQGVGELPYTDQDAAGLERTSLDTLNEVTQSGSLRMIRSGRWKLQVGVTGPTTLYDLQDDPYELIDRSREPGHEPIIRDLLERLVRWQMRAADPLPIVPRGYTRKRHPRNYYWDES
ncbi:MAG TPA: sulfatase-like hydrolase/transferase [Mycobacteriales bacterium]|nr:sulfatase-like hydrolase/transferase [Mycobacteriales bacterium]